MHCWADLEWVHKFRCHNNIHVYEHIALYTADAYSAEREMSASACTRIDSVYCELRCVITAFVGDSGRSYLILSYLPHLIPLSNTSVFCFRLYCLSIGHDFNCGFLNILTDALIN